MDALLEKYKSSYTKQLIRMKHKLLTKEFELKMQQQQTLGINNANANKCTLKIEEEFKKILGKSFHVNASKDFLREKKLNNSNKVIT